MGSLCTCVTANSGFRGDRAAAGTRDRASPRTGDRATTGAGDQATSTGSDAVAHSGGRAASESSYPTAANPIRRAYLSDSDQQPAALHEHKAPPPNDEFERYPTKSHIMTSWSVTCRNEGNKWFSNASGKCPSLQKMNFEKALQFYYKSLSAATIEKETASACKNIAVTSTKLARLARERGDSTKTSVYHSKEALNHFVKAHNAGERDPDLRGVWRDGVIATMKACFDEAVELLRDESSSFMLRMSWMEEYVNIMDIDIYKAEGYVLIARNLFKQGMIYLDDANFQRSLSLMKDCYRPLQEAERLFHGNEAVAIEIAILKEDVFVNSCVAESIQARETGDKLLAKLLLEEEDLYMDLVYDIIDWYHQAVVLTREKEVEMEAIALSRLGVVYDQVLKAKVKAKENFMKCIQLAESLHPKTFNLEDWYKVCVSTLERYQKEVQEQEDKKWNMEREKYVKELTSEIKELNSKDSPYGLLTLIYEKFPPKKEVKKPKPKLDSGDRPAMKKALQAAIIEYHPDKQVDHGPKWKTLCEEIVKRLTGHYETYKA